MKSLNTFKKEHNKWLKSDEAKKHFKVIGLVESSNHKIDLRRADMREVCLLGVDLEGADMRASTLVGVNLSDSDLCNVNFRYADMRSVNLTNCKLVGADFSNADLSGANLSNSDLSGVDLGNTDLNFTIGDGKYVKSVQIGVHLAWTSDRLFINSGKAIPIEKWEVRDERGAVIESLIKMHPAIPTK